MDYFVNGRIKNRKLVVGYVNVLIHALKLNRLNREINIDFVTECDGKVLGYCWGDKDEVNIEISRTHEGRNLKFLEMMQTLTHEMVHARQFLRGELISEKGYRVWKGKSHKDTDYKNYPWEIEAYALEKELFLENFPFFAKFEN